jgi:hypothetical protein
MNMPDQPSRMDRRIAIKWMLAASASLAVAARLRGASAGANAAALTKARGYGRDPSMVKTYQPGEVWPLTFTPAQRRTAVALCDVMIPADETSPSASSVGVPDFIDEWVSAPYPAQEADRPIILEGLAWIETEAQSRFGKEFSGLNPDQQTAICDDICDPAHAKPEHAPAVRFFKRYRDLTAGGYYTTPVGMKAIGYTGNMPLPGFDGPPPEALRHVGLA